MFKDDDKHETCYCENCSRLQQTLDKIEEFCTIYSDNHDAYETVYKEILDIINKSEEV